MAAPVVIVSNRLPVSVKKAGGRLEFEPGLGGLATGLAAYADDKRNKWIGWPGIASDKLTKSEREQIAVELRRRNCYPVFLTQKQLDDFYNGYSNTILWPLFHDLPARLTDHDKFWKAYRAVNSSYAGVVLALSDARSTIWVHDYQLLALPAMLRAVRPKARIGFFLHIPFPKSKQLERISTAGQLLHGVLGADLIGMHTRSYAANFLDSCRQLTHEIVTGSQVVHGAHVSQVTDFPMGIDYDRFTRARDLPGVKRELARHRRKYQGLKVILTVDRLDPTKGLAERLEAYQEFLRRSPAIRGKVVMAMLAVPSRTEVEEYKQLRERVEGLVEAINGEFGTPTWQPVDYMYTSMPVESVTALYQVADVAFITPLRDGMNLVAKEYVASRPNRDGVLILSSTAGAAQELTEALLVNPRRRDSLVDALNSAVRMPKRELRQRISTMHDTVATHTVQHWARTFMGTLQKPVPGTKPITRSLTKSRQQDLIDAYRRARNAVILLDYDGVLVPHVNDPAKAAPPRSVTKLLEKLSGGGAQTAIISGRGQPELDKWLAALPLALVAEHGAQLREYDARRRRPRAWKRLTKVSPIWQDHVLPILEKYAMNTPGAFVETKDFSLVWHYRAASPYYAQKNLVILRRVLKPIARAHGLGAYSGNKILEIKPLDINKGVAVRQMLSDSFAGSPGAADGPPDFILCIGDDYTDEDMFENLPATAYTIKVGRGQTAARYRLRSSEEVISLLKKLTK